jgi:hypothetical protein
MTGHEDTATSQRNSLGDVRDVRDDIRYGVCAPRTSPWCALVRPRA